MKRVVIGMKNGKPFVVSVQGKVEVVFRQERRKSVYKHLKTLWYHMKPSTYLNR